MYKNRILKILDLSGGGIICRLGDENLIFLNKCKKKIFQILFFGVELYVF